MLQAMGAVLMVAGSLVTQRSSGSTAPSDPNKRVFKPRVAVGFFFALIAAHAYGTSPIIVRQALQDVGPLSGLAGASVAYAAATVAVALGLVIPSLRRNVMMVTGENARWFVYSGIFVAAAHGFLYSALAVAPIMVVAPLLQLSLVFRFLFALVLNPRHEVFGFRSYSRHGRFNRGCVRHSDRHTGDLAGAGYFRTLRLLSALAALTAHSVTARRASHLATIPDHFC